MEDRKTIFLGCGTGRCGTESMSRLIDDCQSAVCSHERKPVLPWICNEELFLERVKHFSDAPSTLIGDVASSYLPYVEHFIHSLPSTKVICLERDRQEVINSFMVKTLGYNHWRNHEGKYWIKHPYWDNTFPKYEIDDKAKAIGAYWDEYHTKVIDIAQKYPKHVKILGVDTLNSIEGQKKIFDFLEIEEICRVYKEDCRYNVQKFDKSLADPQYETRFIKKLSKALNDLVILISQSDTSVIVVDEGFRDYLHYSSGYGSIPFTERDNVYWGPPIDDEAAIQEVERLRISGASHIAFAWWTSWWFDYYKEFHNYLRSNFECLIENDRLVIFNLRK